MERKSSKLAVFAVMFGFFVMGFVDIIGMAVNHVKIDFQLDDTLANLLTMSCFFWFLVLSIPTGMLMNKIGRKNTVLISFVLHIIALCIPLISYDFVSILIAFAVIGAGNTLLQVSLNPLVTNVVSKEKLTGTLTLGQFVKAICSFLGPVLTSWASGMAFGWKLIFPIYAVTSLIALVWLWLIPIKEGERNRSVSIGDTLSLFKDKYIITFFIGILVLVGVDVGINTTFPKYLMERCSLELDEAGLGNSVYFFARTIGAFLGGIILLKYTEIKFYIYSVFVAAIGLAAMLLTNNLWIILGSVAVFGLGYSNLFAIIFSLSLKRIPAKANEISALLIMGGSGGALIPPILGVVSDCFNTQVAALAVLIIVWIYMIWLISRIKKIGNIKDA
ncbi:sugar MFS transporter [Dysgonomonas sp. Marseille-P4361]|uniref:MFS transporter n=1 Tax=Dysgonomonas sp. Marseille-P4361 TaxID=2161820 RepID=UPI000D55FF9D|nr:MFS transporter [Dysgonomonas sp. Marseille-P4361]